MQHLQLRVDKARSVLRQHYIVSMDEYRQVGVLHQQLNPTSMQAAGVAWLVQMLAVVAYWRCHVAKFCQGGYTWPASCVEADSSGMQQH